MDSNHIDNDSNPSWRTKWRDWSTDSNHLHRDSNPWIWSYEEQGKAIRIFELWIRIPSQIEVEGRRLDRAIRILELQIRITSWRKIQILQRWFESPKQQFESLTLQKHLLLDLQLQQVDFLIQISLTTARWNSPTVINDRLGIYAWKKHWKENNTLRAKIHQDHSLSLLEPSSAKFLNLCVKWL